MNSNIIKRTETGHMYINLDIYMFKDGQAYIVYAPALDLSGSGNTQKEAEESLYITVQEYFDYTLSKRTLIKDLRAHGWKVQSWKQRKYKAPTVEQLIAGNPELWEILNRPDYTKTIAKVPIPA